jgi:hypothetical protein
MNLRGIGKVLNGDDTNLAEIEMPLAHFESGEPDFHLRLSSAPGYRSS